MYDCFPGKNSKTVFVPITESQQAPRFLQQIRHVHRIGQFNHPRYLFDDTFSIVSSKSTAFLGENV